MSVPGLVDSHCHLDASEFDADRDEVVAAALDAKVEIIVVPAVARFNFETVLALPKRYPGCMPALGIHPLFVDQSTPEDIELLGDLLKHQQPAAVGEIGLDFFIEPHDNIKQEWFFSEQLKLANGTGLPVLMHVRKSVDHILKYLRRIEVPGGIAHAFNGSRQQADILIAMGFKLGFGGAMTWHRAHHLRDLAQTLPLESIVLETDAPDIPPEWLGRKGRNTPDQLSRIAQVLADLRRIPVEEVVAQTTQNMRKVLPHLG